MNLPALALAVNVTVARILDPLQPILALVFRVYVGWQFFKAGLLKLQSWEQTIWLFENEYRTPVLSPAVAAALGTFGELVFPVLLFLGLFGRLGALGLSAVNAMAVVSYAHFLFADGSEAALGDHVLWGTMLLVVVLYGPGKLSLDHWLARSRGALPDSGKATQAAV